MSKAIQKTVLDVLTADQAKRVDRINAYHESAINSAKGEMVYRFLTGYEMIQLKAITPHGQWEPLRDANFKGMPSSTATLYVRDAQSVLETKSANVADLDFDHLQLTDGRLPEKQETKLLKALEKVFDGKSITEFRRSVGLMPPKPQDGGFRPNAEAVQDWLKEHHPELVGTKYNDLEPKIQKAFAKQYKRLLPAELKSLAGREAWRAVMTELSQLFRDGKHTLGTPEEREEDDKLFADIRASFKEMKTKKK